MKMSDGKLSKSLTKEGLYDRLLDSIDSRYSLDTGGGVQLIVALSAEDADAQLAALREKGVEPKIILRMILGSEKREGMSIESSGIGIEEVGGPGPELKEGLPPKEGAKEAPAAPEEERPVESGSPHKVEEEPRPRRHKLDVLLERVDGVYGETRGGPWSWMA
jgi:hypothetical protein